MAYRIANVFGFELMLNMDDRARSSALWQYVLKPAAFTMSKTAALIDGAVASAGPSGGATSVVLDPAIPAGPVTPEQQEILDKIKGIEWYHTIDLGHGIKTPGRFNHPPLLKQYMWPERLDGLRALDVATMNGFWAFEMERRGAREVVAVDVEKLGQLDIQPRERLTLTPEQLAKPRDAAFNVAKEILGSNVSRHNMTIYELSPERVGKFDFVFCGDLLLHVMNPVKAAANICSVTSGEAYIVDCFSPFVPQMAVLYQGADQGTWWNFSFSALEKILRDAGFKKVELLNKFKAPANPGQAAILWRAVFRCTN